MFGLLTLVLLSQIIALPVRAENLPDLSGESENIQTDDDIDGADPAEGETPQPDSPPSEQPPASEVLEPPTPPGGSGTLDDWSDEVIDSYTDTGGVSATGNGELALLEDINLSLTLLVEFVKIAAACLVIWFFIIKPIYTFVF